MTSSIRKSLKIIGLPRRKRIKKTAALTVCLTVWFTATLVAAEDRWDFSLGAGIAVSNVYPGSDKSFVAPFPRLNASYAGEHLSFSLSLLDGIGLTYMNQEHALLGSISLNAGGKRDSQMNPTAALSTEQIDSAREFLEDSPAASTPIHSDVMLGYLTPIGIFGASIGYHPTTVEYAPKDLDDKMYHGFLYSLFYLIELPVTKRLSCAGTFGLELMDKNYADAWYSVEYETEELDVFEADAGLRDAQLALQVTYMLSERIGISVLEANTFLLMDAGKSPYTVERFQLTTALSVFYNF